MYVSTITNSDVTYRPTAKVEATGAACSLQSFMYGFAPNVICHYPSLHESTERVILSAHYDSRGSLGLLQAPGGDDDGSGSGHLLGVAEAIKSQQVEFERSVTLAFFAGEEQGLFGSHAYAGESPPDAGIEVHSSRVPAWDQRHCPVAHPGGHVGVSRCARFPSLHKPS